MACCGLVEVLLRRYAGCLYNQEEYPRDRATWQGRVAISQLRSGRLDEACASGREAVDLLAGQVESERGQSFLSTFRAELAQFKNSPSARDFLDYEKHATANRDHSQ